MKLTLLLLTFVCLLPAAAQNTNLEHKYEELRHAIDSIAIYDSYQQQRIDSLKANYSSILYKDKSRAQTLCTDIFKAYSKFCYDSAAVYIDRSIALAVETHNADAELEARILQARYYGKGGSYVEALSLINAIDAAHVPAALLPLYYDAVRAIYQEAGNSLRHSDMRTEFLSKSNDNRARLFGVSDTTTYHILNLREGKARYDKHYDEALYCSNSQLRIIAYDSPEYSEAAFFRSCTYRDLGNREMQRYWLIESALSDIRNSIKDQASLWSLAQLLAEDGDTELSYLLIRTSHDGLSYYNAPLRYLQSVNILSMVDHNYQIMTTEQNSKLRVMLWLISLLALLLTCATVYIYRQMKRLAAARRQLHMANDNLQTLNAQLNETVASLNVSNQRLSETGAVKDLYLGRFLSLCSEYMKKMESFRSTVLKKEKSGQLQEYLSKSRMRELKAQELAEFTADFDRAFLHLVPTFIDDFNALLQPEGRIEPADPFTLTTELRIFALIRLGINDSSKIAEFLHYSVQTIYNYRSSVKNYALGERNAFEDAVRGIGKQSHGQKPNC